MGRAVRRPQTPVPVLLAAIAAVVVIATVGALLTPTREFPVAAVLLGPLAGAIVLPWKPTALLAALALVAGTLLAFFDTDLGGAQLTWRLLFLVGACVLIVLLCAARDERQRERAEAETLRDAAADQERVIDRLQGLQDAVTAAARAAIPEEVATAVVAEGCRTLGTRAGLVFGRSGSGYRLLVVAGTARVDLDDETLRSIGTHESVFDCGTPGDIDERLSALGPAIVALPMRVQHDTIGIALVARQAGASLTEQDRAHLQTLADAGAVALRRVTLHQQIAEHNTLYASISNSVDDIVFAKDLDGRYLYMNAAGARLLRRTRDAVIGHTDAELMSAERAALARAQDRAVIESGEVQSSEDVVGAEPSTTRVYQSIKAPLRDGSGAVIGVAGIARDVTYRHELEQALKRVERRYRALAQSSEVGVISGSREEIAEVNAAFIRMLGYPPETTVSALVHKTLTPPEWRDADRAAREEAQRTRTIPLYEKEFLRADGTRLPALVAGATFEDGGGWIVLVTDLSPLRAVEAELRHSESRYRTLAEATTSLVWTADARGAMHEPLDSWHEYTGQTTEAARGFGWLEAVHPDDRVHLDAWLGHPDRVRPWEGRVRLWHARSGRHRFVHARTVPVFVDGRPVEWIGTVTDVHEQTVADLRAGEDARFRRAVLQSLQDGLLVTDAAGRVIEVNDAWTRVSGFDRSESLGAVPPYPWWPDQVDDAAGAATFAAMQHEVAQGASGEWEVVLRHRDGHSFPAITSLAVLRDAQGVVTMVVGTVKDITERKATEDALRTERDQREAIVSALQEGLCVTDRTGRILEVNDAWTRVTGYARDDCIGLGPPFPWYPRGAAERAALQATLSDAVERHRFGEIETPIERADGVERRVVLMLHPLPDDDGGASGFVTTMRDITRRSAAEAQLRLIADLTTELSATNEPEQVGRAALSMLMPTFGADIGALLQLDTEVNELRIVTAVGARREVLDRFRRVPLNLPSPAVDAVRLRELVVVRDGNDSYASLDEFRIDDGVRANIDLPLCKGDVVVGVLVLAFRRDYRPDVEDEELLHSVAPLVAQALDRARLFAFERSVAGTLQQAMLAPYPLVPREFAVAARYEPAVATLEVGGDWYDVTALDDGRLAVAVGDTVGRGLTAAAVMGQLRSALHAIARTTGTAAEAVMSIDRFAFEISGAKAATLVYAIVDPKTRSVTYTRAGHPPPLVIEATGETRFLEGAGSWPLAVTNTVQPRAQAVDTLAPGSTLLCYTDGLIERRGEHLGTGLERLADAAAKLADLPVEDLCDELLTALLGQGEHADDVGLVALRLVTVDTPAFSCRIPAESRELGHVRRLLRGWLERQHVPEYARGDIVLAVGEACTNAIEHAYPENHARGVVVIEGRRTLDDVVLTVRDHGSWRPRPPDPRRNRGLRLIGALMDDVAVTSPGDGGTRVRMRLRVDDTRATR